MYSQHAAESSNAPMLDVIQSYIQSIASFEPRFGHAGALLEHGREFPARVRKPRWLILGPRKSCFKSATTYGIRRYDVFYAEGYAIDWNLPIPIHHAWLVNQEGEVFDPTWGDTIDHVYFGIAFSRSFVLESLVENFNEPGILLNMDRMRRRLRSSEAIELAIARGIAPTGPNADVERVSL